MSVQSIATSLHGYETTHIDLFMDQLFIAVANARIRYETVTEAYSTIVEFPAYKPTPYRFRRTLLKESFDPIIGKGLVVHSDAEERKYQEASPHERRVLDILGSVAIMKDKIHTDEFKTLISANHDNCIGCRNREQDDDEVSECPVLSAIYDTTGILIHQPRNGLIRVSHFTKIYTNTDVNDYRADELIVNKHTLRIAVRLKHNKVKDVFFKTTYQTIVFNDDTINEYAHYSV